MPMIRLLPSPATICCLGLLYASALNADDAHEFVPDIVAEDFAAHVRVLASDEFGGRRPGTAGEQKTLQYLFAQFQRMGLEPGNGDSYLQKVPVQVRLADWTRSRAGVDLGGQAMALNFGTHVVLGSDTGQSEVSVAHSPLVFVGYGINAPDQRWNDYAGTDVRGKTVLVLAGEPDVDSAQRELFEGRRLTHYSRYGYKMEEAARQGAVAAIIIHHTADVGYDWDGVKSRWHRTEFALRPGDSLGPRLNVQGWIAADSARALFAASGKNLSDLRRAAGRPGFKAEALGQARFNATLKGKVVLGESNNFIAKLTGATYPDEAVLYSAHWDHLGAQEQKSGDNIYNGALDNASGVAAILEIAARFAAQRPKPERTIVFFIPTLEEFGLLGSRYYIAHPVIPLADTVADINFDMVVPVGRARDFVVIGYGYSELDEVVKPIVDRLGRRISADKPANGDSFFRSDHLNFARAGVPVLYMRGGVESAGTNAELAPPDEAWNRVASVYHTADDEFRSNWDLRGIAEDISVSYEVGRTLASSRDWPNYRHDHAFREFRDASREAARSR